MADTIYFQKIDSLTSLEISNNSIYSIKQMIANLKLYEQLAWSNSKYDKFRENYYIMLLNNAYFSNLRGSSIYYAEKVKKITSNSNRSRPMIELSVKADLYTLQQRHDMVASTYENEKIYFSELLLKAEKHPKQHFLEVLDAIAYLKTVFNAYANLNDNKHSNEVYKLANQLGHAIHNVNESPYNSLLKEFNLLTLQYFYDTYNKLFDNALVTLEKISNLSNKYPQLSTNFIKYHVYEWKTDLFIELKQVDSAYFYLNKYEQIPQFAESQKMWIHYHKAELAVLKGKNHEAVKWLQEALKESAAIQSALATQLDDLLYTQTQAEHHLLALEKSEKEHTLKKNWIIIISSFSVLFIVALTIYWQIKQRKLHKKINELNDISELQIIHMEQFEEKIRNEEREIFSQNLHDDLAGSLIAIKNSLEVLSYENPSQKIKELSDFVLKTYLEIRSKSHKLNELANVSNEKIFSNHILKLGNIAFPSPHYTFHFILDPNCIDHTSLALKSDLIRSIKELFSNIIKHSKATVIELVIYRETDGLYISLKNNKKFHNNTRNLSHKGFQFLHKRLNKYAVNINTQQVQDTFEIIIFIPQYNLY